MTVVDAICERCLAITAVTTLVGTRVYALTFQQNQGQSAIRVQQISETEDVHLRGAVGLKRTRVQVDALAPIGTSDAYAGAHAISDAAHGDFVSGAPTGLNGWVGTLSGVEIRAIVPADKREFYDAEERRAVIVSRDYFVTWLM